MTNILFDALLPAETADDRPLLLLANGRAMDYAGMRALSGRLAHALRATGAQPGDRVAVQVEKSPEALALYLACLRSGIVFLPLNTAYTAAELDYFIGDAQPAILVCDSHKRALLAPLAETHRTRLVTLDADGTGELMQAALAAPDHFETVPCAADDLAAILYTSGSTGRSKGAMLTHANLLSNARALVSAWRFTRNDVLLHALPIFHVHGLFVATNVTLLAGGSMIFLPKFDAGEVARLLPSATAMMGIPTFYTRLLANEAFTAEAARNIRLFVSGSAPLLAETFVEFERRSGHAILERYGMSETSMNTSNPYEGERRPGTVGFPLPGVELKICDPVSGAPLERGEIGMIEVRGPNVFKGYWRMPEKTKAELREDGFFITGDLGLIDADGYVVIVGRGKDLVISGGLNVYPKEIENEINAIEGVVESAVFGVPHPDFGEAVVAAVVLEAGAILTEADIAAALRDRLAGFKQPKRVFLMEELPRNAMGKVLKNLLRDRHATLFQG